MQTWLQLCVNGGYSFLGAYPGRFFHITVANLVMDGDHQFKHQKVSEVANVPKKLFTLNTNVSDTTPARN